MLLSQWFKQTIKQIPNQESAQLEAQALVTHITGLNPLQQRLEDAQLTNKILERLNSAAQRLISGEPLAYILGWQPFYNLNLKVTPDTLIPRGDTEFMVDITLRQIQKIETPIIVDLGTGSGAIALALAKSRGDSYVLATDNSLAALTVAQENASNNQIENVSFFLSNWLDALAKRSIDIIISNPPYIAAGDNHLDALRYEPNSALIAQNNGFADLFTIIEQASSILKPNGWLFLEHGHEQKSRLQSFALKTKCWQSIETYEDYGNRPRVTALQLKA